MKANRLSRDENGATNVDTILILGLVLAIILVLVYVGTSVTGWFGGLSNPIQDYVVEPIQEHIIEPIQEAGETLRRPYPEYKNLDETIAHLYTAKGKTIYVVANESNRVYRLTLNESWTDPRNMAVDRGTDGFNRVAFNIEKIEMGSERPDDYILVPETFVDLIENTNWLGESYYKTPEYVVTYNRGQTLNIYSRDKPVI
jgi:Flp pilus assembly pilin Flp